MESVLEILIWVVVVMIVFYTANIMCYIRTAASFVLSLLTASILIYFIYRSIFGEIVFMLAITIATIYAIFRAIRDKRDDAPAVNQKTSR